MLASFGAAVIVLVVSVTIHRKKKKVLTIPVLDYHILFNDLYILVTSANTIHLEMTKHAFQLKHSQIYYLNRVV